MGYKEIMSLDSDTTIALGGVNKKTGKKNPLSVEGYYLGSRTVASKKAKSGLAKIHYFQTEDGNVGVWGKTDTDRKLETAVLGQMTLVTFDKMKPTPNGDMYTYKVQQDPDNSIEVFVQNTNSNDTESSYQEGSSDSEDSGTDEDSSQSDEDEEDARQAAALAAAERKAKVQAMLKKGAATTKN